MNTKTGFTNQVAVVTGAGSGIGKAIATRLAVEGAIVCGISRNLQRLESISADNPSIASQLRGFLVDLTIDKEIRDFAIRLKHDFDQVNLLIHSAGVFSSGLIESSPIEELDQQYTINVRAPYALTQALLPMIKACQGQIVFINSSVSLRNVQANLSQYGASKHALKALADSLRDEVNTAGVRVLSIYPGRTATPMQENIYRLENRPYSPDRLIQPEDIAMVVINTLSLPRSVEVTDINIRSMINPL